MTHCDCTRVEGSKREVSEVEGVALLIIVGPL